MNPEDHAIIREDVAFDSPMVIMGIFLMIPGLILLTLSENILMTLPAFFIITIGIALFFVRKYIEVNFKDKTIFRYTKIFSYKGGHKETISGYTIIVLAINHDSTRMNSRGSSTTVRTRSYDVYLTNAKKNKFPVYEFTSIIQAQKFLKSCTDGLNLEAIDQYDILTSSAQVRSAERKKKGLK